MGFQLIETYEALSDLGLVRSKRHFSRLLGHHWSYLRDVERRDNDAFRVPSVTVERLRTRLHALIPFLSRRSAAEVEQVVARIDQHTAVADHLGYGLREHSVNRPKRTIPRIDARDRTQWPG